MPARILRPIKERKPSNRRKRILQRICFPFTLLLLLFSSIMEISYLGSFFSIVIFLLVFSDLFNSYGLRTAFLQSPVGTFLSPLVRRLRQFHILQGRGEKIPPLSAEQCVCRNCGTTFTGNFCPRCGQNSNVRRFKALSILSNVLRAFTRLAYGFKRTSVELLWRPGYMMADFLKGKRVRYIQPFQMLFLLVAFYMLFVKVVDPVSLNRIQQIDTISDAVKAVTEMPGQTNLPKRETDKEFDSYLFSFTKDLDKANKQLNERLKPGEDTHSYLKQLNDVFQKWSKSNKILDFLFFIPLFGFTSRFIFKWNKFPAYNTTEHFYIQTYIVCQHLLIGILLMLFMGKTWLVNSYGVPEGLMYLLFMWDFRELFCKSWLSSFWKMVELFLYTMIIYFLVSGLYVLGLMLYGGLLK